MKISLRWVASVTAALVALLALAVPASAHSDLVDSTPASGDRLTVPPRQVELVFSENVQQSGGAIVVKAPDGNRVDQAATFTTRQNVARVQLTDATAPGRYSVTYRVVSADGHVVTGSFAYQLAAAATADSDPPSDDPTPSSLTAETPADDSTDDQSAGFVWVLGAGAIGLVLVAAIVAVAMRGRRGQG